MSRLNAAADPADAIRQGFYVEPGERSIAKQLATRLELEPASSHPVVGGVGAGNTTQLLLSAAEPPGGR